MTKDEASLIARRDAQRTHGPWSRRSQKSKREHPDDGNRAISLIVERLRAHGVPVTVHAPMLYLTLPKGAHVEADGRRLHARPAPDDAFAAAGRRGGTGLLSPSRSGRRKVTARRARSCLGQATTRRPACPT